MTTYRAPMPLSLAMLLLAAGGALAQQPASVEAPITTGFGVYSPYQTPQYRLDAGRSEPEIARGFSNVSTADGRLSWDQYFTVGERSLLQRNNFVVRPEAFGTFAELYAKTSGSQRLGTFVTVDAVLHGLRVSVAEMRQKVEREYLMPELGELLERLSSRLAGQLNGGDPAVAAAVQQALAYVETGRALLDPTSTIHPRVRETVAAEVRAIDAAGGAGVSSVFPGRRIDYSAFAPTGHYRAALANYFRAHAWLGTVGLPLRESDLGATARSVRAATVLARTVEQLSSEGDFGARYQALFDLLSFLDGRSELDVTVDMVAGAVRGYYGKRAGTGVGLLASDTAAAVFGRYIETQAPAPVVEAPGARFVRLIPGPSTARGLVDRVAASEAAPSRVAAAAAAASVAGADEYRRAFGSRLAESWIGSLESALLYTVQPVASSMAAGEGAPRFLRSPAWTQLGAVRALGAWADYRHPLTTLPMRTIRVGLARGASGDIGTAGYVEPAPEAWARVASLAGYIRGGFTSSRLRGIIGSTMETRLRDIENASARLMQIAAAELGGKELTGEQNELIASMPARIAAYESFTDPRLSPGGWPVVAGAATVRSGVRAPATGHPLTVFVIVPRNDGEGGLMLTRGGVYSYYETSSPESFVRSITSGSGDVEPALPVAGYVDQQREFSQLASRFEAIEGALPSAVAAYTPSREERRRMAPPVELRMESNAVSRTDGELWFTVKAPLLDGSDIIISVLNSGGREIYRMPAVRLEGGERYDLVRAEELQPGMYFLRVTDHSGRTLASGRFAVVQ